MADFARALPFVLNHEVIGWPRDENGRLVKDIAAGMAAVKDHGKLHYWYTDDPDDPGGATAWGIILATARKYGIETKDELKAITADQVAEIYRSSFWFFAGVIDQGVATKVLDMKVNLRGAVRLIQGVLNTLGASLDEDGFWGLRTETSLNAVDPDLMLAMLCQVTEARYREIVTERPKSAKYLDGWLARAAERP